MGSVLQHRMIAGLCAALLVALAAGCGGGSSATSTGKSANSQAAAQTTTATTPTQPSSTTPPAHVAQLVPTAQVAPEPAPTILKVKITSPSVGKNSLLPAQYTCDGSDVSLPLRWKGIPAGTAELMLDVLNIQPVNGKLYFDWAVAGINPKSSGTAAGTIPPGAVVGVGTDGHAGYSVCPAKTGKRVGYVAVLFSLPHRLRAKPGFSATALRLQAERTAQFEGFSFFDYTRR
jgi:phosphatidylethanolamine-binding protein (PEBP) family uncharacterized protein